MMLVAKRRLRETWRDAVRRRAAETGQEAEALAAFDGGVAAGESEATAAYRALEAEQLLWPLPESARPAALPTQPSPALPADRDAAR